MKSLVVANWKMNPASLREARQLFEATKKAADTCPALSVVVMPPSIYIRELSGGYRGKRLAFGAQHVSAEPGGSHTGEISIAQVKDAKAKYVLIGHAERRALGESNEDTQKQVAAALAQKLTPILCVGERTRESGGEHFAFVKDQLRAGFSDVADSAAGRVMVAYEPVWAIGADVAMSPREMHEMSIFIRKSIVEFRGQKGHAVSVIYGGAIDDQNAALMMREGDVSGLLIGRASTNAKEFALLLRAIKDITISNT